MAITHVEPADRAGFLELVNAEIRPDRAKTNALDDFPVILGAENSAWQLVFRTETGMIAGCIAALIRDLKTSCGNIPVAGIGSVVTRPEFRGKGLSRALQNEMLNRLKGKNIPLAVLWTDQPEIYTGRGFDAAGWEIHVSLAHWRPEGPLETALEMVPFRQGHLSQLEHLYRSHLLHTLRHEGDSGLYYGMPGTRGLVACRPDGSVAAYAFCGKGADFPRYICEWGGEPEALWPLLVHIREEDLADHILVPPGTEDLVNPLVDEGCAWRAIPSGQWAVLDPEQLTEHLKPGEPAPADIRRAAAWLGDVAPDGQPLVGPITAAVWGFDSV